MKNSKTSFKVAIFIIMVLAILLSGFSFGAKKTTTSAVPDIYTGVLGVDAAFNSDTVQKTAGYRTNALVVLTLTNLGAHPVPLSDVRINFRDTLGMFGLKPTGLTDAETGGKQSITGDSINKAIKKEDKENKQLTGLEGKDVNVFGSIFPILIKAIETIRPSGTIQTALIATVCYKEETVLNANVCIDRTPYSFQKVRKACDPDTVLKFVSQGAPVAVTKIETITERSSLDDGTLIVIPKFNIYVSNVGNGMIIDKNSLDLFCTDNYVPKTESGKINRVYINSVVLGNGAEAKTLKCGSDDSVSEVSMFLSSDSTKNFITCKLADTDKPFTEMSGAFVTPLRIGLSYGYTSTSAPVPITIKTDASESR